MQNTRQQSASGKAATPLPARDPEGIRRKLVRGLAVVALLGAGLGGFGTTMPIAGAVLAPGNVVVESYVKKVQHQTGGIVGEILVKDGDLVIAGDVVVRLDATVSRANLQIIVKQLNELAVRRARLLAERDGARRFDAPPSLTAASDPEVKDLIEGERTLFEIRAAARAGQKAQLSERVAQLFEDIKGLGFQQQAKAREIELVQTELTGQQELWAKNLIAITKYTSMQREAARLQGERGQLVSSVAQARAKISETQLQIKQIEEDLRAEAMKDLREIQAKESELLEHRIAAEDQLKRIDIRATQTGVVHQMAVHTVGGVISPGEPVMLIVPRDDLLVIEARIAPNDIDHVRIGQSAIVRFSAFNQRTTPEFEGRVARLSPDLTRDPQSNAFYFVARIALTAEEERKLGDLRLVPGMPAEVHVRTGDRTMMSYLMKPLQDQMAIAFRER